MNNQQPLSPQSPSWQWPLNPTVYDQGFELSQDERAELACRFDGASTSTNRICPSTKVRLFRLLQPIDDALAYIKLAPDKRLKVMRVLCIEMHWRDSSFWSWSLEEWKEILAPNDTIFTTRYGWHEGADRNPARRWLPVVAYLLQVHPHAALLFDVMTYWGNYARRIFGEELVSQNIQRLRVPLQKWGYRNLQGTRLEHRLDAAVGYLLLRNGSPYLEDIPIELLETLYESCTHPSIHNLLVQISRSLWALDILTYPLAIQGKPLLPASGTDGSVSDEWLSWCQRWRKTSILQQPQKHYYALLKVGRWLQVNHPAVKGPADWSYELAAELVAALNTMKVGEWSDPSPRSQSQLRKKQFGQPLGPVGKNAMLKAMRVFLHDCQEWHWIPVTINPHRAFRTPLAIQRQIGTNPRVIDKELWAKILWAAMNLQEEDLPRNARDYLLYPFEMVRALATVWCFAALRSDEIWRLRVGCIRWQYEDVMIPETGEMLPKDAVCFLDVPVNKTSRAYTKAVHTLVGRRINEWEQVRPQEQPHAIDHKTGEQVQFLFAYRGMRVSKTYINETLMYVIPNTPLPLWIITSERRRGGSDADNLLGILPSCSRKCSCTQLARNTSNAGSG
ncbi:hypothetical protein KSF_015540 [Reticulibacter mediterranei]|uniref:Uncharacterized protein n=1 Tax=Reticulibacter mediterranei TaxID=2778369 RepID=A0A8J3IL41_9CHLR|nr:hypothetical protein [Reticulibacter mediterranei]GHO91506.1 hypothetical protein KSF_015540 [Reticulibacter mediterranei]